MPALIIAWKAHDRPVTHPFYVAGNEMWWVLQKHSIDLRAPPVARFNLSDSWTTARTAAGLQGDGIPLMVLERDLCGSLDLLAGKGFEADGIPVEEGVPSRGVAGSVREATTMLLARRGSTR